MEAAVAEVCADGICTRADQGGHVVGDEGDTLVVFG